VIPRDFQKVLSTLERVSICSSLPDGCIPIDNSLCVCSVPIATVTVLANIYKAGHSSSENTKCFKIWEFCLMIFFQDVVTLYDPGWSWTHRHLSASSFPAWIKGMLHHSPAVSFLLLLLLLLSLLLLLLSLSFSLTLPLSYLWIKYKLLATAPVPFLPACLLLCPPAMMVTDLSLKTINKEAPNHMFCFISYLDHGVSSSQ
jgi:hypothetical protein